ncbi:MAG: polymer-forming cytoskeletal protein [Alphaproteobacteria bacterium]|jgi:cytoskeletal protein CcmA (bactofilin family)|nr:polymer-forming cytoskeletal protein [Alphaproteobacteria bacterium]
MFSKKNKTINNNIVEVTNFASKKSIPSIIVSDLNIKGDLISEGAIEIGGIVTGNIKCNFVTVRRGAKIKGNIIADNLTINGDVEGIMQAKHLAVTATAKVKGALEYGFLNIEAGANIDGKLVKKQYEELSIIQDVNKLNNICEANNKNTNILELEKQDILDVSKKIEKTVTKKQSLAKKTKAKN